MIVALVANKLVKYPVIAVNSVEKKVVVVALVIVASAKTTFELETRIGA